MCFWLVRCLGSTSAFLQTKKEVFLTFHDYNLAWVYQFIPALLTLTLFEGYRCVRIIKSPL